MPSIDITTTFCQKGECDLMFYKKSIAFHIIDRALRLSDGCEVTDKETDTLLDAYTTTWIQHHDAFETLYSDGELGLNNDRAKEHLKRLGTHLQVRAPEQHARLAEARQSMLRHVMHLTETELARHNATIPFRRLYGEALFVVNAFSFYNGVSPYNALTGRQPACLPEFENIDFQKDGEQSDGQRERRIREVAIEAITQSTAVAKVNRALKTQTTVDGSRLYKRGDLIDFHRPTATKDEHGGWNGPYSVLRNEPERGRVVCTSGKRHHEINVRYPDARLTLFMEAIWTMEVGRDNDAMDTVLDYISRLQTGKAAETFGYTGPQFRLTTATQRAPRMHLALQYVIRNFFRIQDVFAIRVGNCTPRVSKCEEADSCVLVYYASDADPEFYYYETADTALDLQDITCSNKSRILQFLIKKGCQLCIDDYTDTDIARVLSPFPPTVEVSEEDNSTANPPTPAEDGRLPTIQEDNEETSLDDLIMETFYAELVSTEPLEPDHSVEETLKYSPPVHMMPEGTVLLMAAVEPDQVMPGNPLLESVTILISDVECPESYIIDKDEIGPFVELCFTPEMAQNVLSEQQFDSLKSDDVATMRVYISAESKRTVVVKEDDLLSKKDMELHWKAVAEAIVSELKIWFSHKCFKKCLLKDARNVMTSRYVAKWKWVKDDKGQWKKIVRMRLCLRGFMDIEAFSLDTFSGTAKRASQRILASEAACHDDWIIASLDIDKAFLQGFTYKELAEATGEKERMVCFKLPPGSATQLRKFPGFEDYDETIHCLQCIKPGTGTKDAPRAFSLKLRKTTKTIGLVSTSYDPEFEIRKDLLTCKHVDDITMGGKEQSIDQYTKEVEKIFGKCKMNKRQFTNCGVRYTMLDNHDIALDQDEYISTLRPIVSSELTGAPADKDATKNVTDLFVSLRGALAYTTLTQAWIQVYIVSLQRIQQPKNIDIRRLNAVTRKLRQEPKKLIFSAMTCTGTLDLHTDSGYRRVEDAEDHKGYGMRGLCLLRRGDRPNNKGKAVHLLDSVCKSHRLTVRSSYGAEMLAAAHGYDDAYPTLLTLIELKQGVLKPETLKRYRETGGLNLVLKVTLTIDAEGVYKSLTSRDLKTPAEKTLLGHVCWLREMLTLGLINTLQWCDTRDMTADGHTKGSIDRELLLEVMIGKQSFKHDTQRHTPHRKTEVQWRTQ